MCTLSVSNVIYHKFSHGADFYMLNWKNVNVILEFDVSEHQGPLIPHTKLYQVVQVDKKLIFMVLLFLVMTTFHFRPG